MNASAKRIHRTILPISFSPKDKKKMHFKFRSNNHEAQQQPEVIGMTKIHCYSLFLDLSTGTDSPYPAPGTLSPQELCNGLKP